MTRPFEGIRIIDITHVLAGPFAAYQLAVLGADVIKVEHPEEPDQSRVNLPPRSGSDVKGVRLTRLGTRVFSQSVTPMKDPWGREIYWIGGGDITWTGDADSDFRAIDEGYVSVTPLHLDLTHFNVLDSAKTWWADL